MKHLIALRLVMLSACLLAGCDDEKIPDSVVRNSAERDRAMAQFNRPTTQDVEKVPLRKQILGAFPLSLRIPQNWEMTTIAQRLERHQRELGIPSTSIDAGNSPVVVCGLAASGEITIQLHQDFEKDLTPQKIDQFLAAARKEAADKPHAINKVELRDLGKCKILEQRLIANKYVDGKLPPEQIRDVEHDVPGPDGRRAGSITLKEVVDPHLVKWMLTVFIPNSSGTFTPRGLSFVTLRLSEFEKDRAFLEKLVSSLQFEEPLP